MGPYAIGVIFACGVFASTFVYNIFFMNLPVEGDPAEISSYVSARPKQHLFGWLGGIVWCTGATAGMVALAAPETLQPGLAARAFVGQAAPLLTALVGILVWRELTGSDVRVKALTVLTLLLYGCGVAMVSAAPLYLPKL